MSSLCYFASRMCFVCVCVRACMPVCECVWENLIWLFPPRQSALGEPQTGSQTLNNLGEVLSKLSSLSLSLFFLSLSLCFSFIPLLVPSASSVQFVFSPLFPSSSFPFSLFVSQSSSHFSHLWSCLNLPPSLLFFCSSICSSFCMMYQVTGVFLWPALFILPYSLMQTGNDNPSIKLLFLLNSRQVHLTEIYSSRTQSCLFCVTLVRFTVTVWLWRFVKMFSPTLWLSERCVWCSVLFLNVQPRLTLCCSTQAIPVPDFQVPLLK